MNLRFYGMEAMKCCSRINNYLQFCLVKTITVTNYVYIRGGCVHARYCFIIVDCKLFFRLAVPLKISYRK